MANIKKVLTKNRKSHPPSDSDLMTLIVMWTAFSILCKMALFAAIYEWHGWGGVIVIAAINLFVDVCNYLAIRMYKDPHFIHGFVFHPDNAHTHMLLSTPKRTFDLYIIKKSSNNKEPRKKE